MVKYYYAAEPDYQWYVICAIRVRVHRSTTVRMRNEGNKSLMNSEIIKPNEVILVRVFRTSEQRDWNK